MVFLGRLECTERYCCIIGVTGFFSCIAPLNTKFTCKYNIKFDFQLKNTCKEFLKFLHCPEMRFITLRSLFRFLFRGLSSARSGAGVDLGARLLWVLEFGFGKTFRNLGFSYQNQNLKEKLFKKISQEFATSQILC